MMEEAKKTAKPIERVTILDCHREKLARLTEQANAAMGGIASISKSDIVNMILGDHPDALSYDEVERLRAAHVDQVKLALWLADAAREAKKAGESVSLVDLLARCESAQVTRKPRAVPRTRKPKLAGTEVTEASKSNLSE